MQWATLKILFHKTNPYASVASLPEGPSNCRVIKGDALNLFQGFPQQLLWVAIQKGIKMDETGFDWTAEFPGFVVWTCGIEIPR